MTTRVEVYANHGWPVDVTPISRPGGERGATTRIAASAHGTAYVHSGQDLLIREVQLAGLEAEAAAANEAAPADPGQNESQAQATADIVKAKGK